MLDNWRINYNSFSEPKIEFLPEENSPSNCMHKYKHEAERSAMLPQALRKNINRVQSGIRESSQLECLNSDNV
ncbi:uncharacterized protein RCO7_14225 [Rhynchosporium graminicola]|uniref:Uncharacterized protein n=1 Tax=Rhynchosporium graminicola TaxID=2792576 RepID=A0A1E1K0D1_9HELO|nr:uncharacterized protein RCO7_14225 [Rhynchosporium commune]